MNKQVKVNINNKDYYCDSEIFKYIMRLQDKVELLEYNIDKAIEYIENVNYNNKIASAYEDNNTTECTKKQIIEQEIRHDNYILSILRGEE